MYRIKRNNAGKFWLFFIITIAIIITILPLKPTSVTVAEEYTELEEATEQIPEEAIEEVEQTITKTNESATHVPVNYEIIEDGNMYRTTDDDLKYANQDYLITIDERITHCPEYEYKFKKGTRIINTEENKICLNDTRIEDFTLTELYVGDLEDHHFEIEFTKEPQKTSNEPEEYTETALVNVTVTKYKNITYFQNVTKTRNKETIEWQWFCAYR